MSQRTSPAAAGVDVRQIRRYEAGEQQPLLSVAVAIADALGISVAELAGKPSHRIKLGGAVVGVLANLPGGDREDRLPAGGDQARRRPAPGRHHHPGLSDDEGGYHWSGELRLWDNEILMGWYAANDGSIRSKGTMYFVLHPHGLNMSGRWVGLGYDGRIMSGWASMGQTREESETTMASLISSEGVAYVND